jgi:hypothetical protein
MQRKENLKMATHDDKQAQPGKATGKEANPAGASRPSRANEDDDDVSRMNLSGDIRAVDSGSGKVEDADDDRLRDGT